MPIWRLPPQPIQRPYTVPIIIGGTTYELSLTESFKGSESIKGSLTILASITDILKETDTSGGRSTFNPTNTEGVKNSDTRLAGLMYLSSLIDNVKNNDVRTYLLSTFPALTDGGKLSDARTTIANMNNVLAEGIKLSDLASGGMSFLNSLTEGIKLSDGNLSAGTATNVTIKPNAAGDLTEIPLSTGTHYQDTNDTNDATHVYTHDSGGSGAYVTDLYNFENPSITPYVINSVRIYARACTEYTSAVGYIALKTHGSTYTYSKTLASYPTYGEISTDALTVNPSTGIAWTITELNDIQAGMQLWDSSFSVRRAFFSDIWIVVNYSPIVYSPITGLGFNLTLSEGTKLSELYSLYKASYPTLSDIVKVSDIITLAHTLYVSGSEGVKLSDTRTSLGVFIKSLTDGTKFNDNTASYFQILLSITDGMKLSDLRALSTGAYNLILSESIKVSDLLTLIGSTQLSVTDRITLSDSSNIGRILAAILIYLFTKALINENMGSKSNLVTLTGKKSKLEVSLLGGG
jgi:hypothetical protein